jgi:hypothetical protein
LDILERHADKWTPEPNTGCMIWTAAINNVERPVVGVAGNKIALVSRLVCEETYGPPPTPKHQAAHNTLNGCVGGLCVNGGHLRWATPRENLADRTPEMASRGGYASWVNNKNPRNIGPRDAALMAGEAVYYPTKPCKRGHMGPNRVKGDCIQCVNIRNASRDRR